MDPVDHLTNLGLSDYEARAYAALVRMPNQTADQVSDEATVPKGRIYDVLNKLGDRGLVRSDRDRPRTYRAVDPEVAMDRLLEQKASDLESKRNNYERKVDEARAALDAVDPVERDEEFWTSAVKEDEARDLLLERLSVAENEVAIFTGSLDVDPTTWQRAAAILGELLDSDVDIRLLMDEDRGISDDLLQEYHRLVEAGLEVRRASLPSRSHFYVIDDDEACVEVPHPAAQTTMLAVINFRDSEIVDDLAESFGSIWAEATPIS